MVVLVIIALLSAMILPRMSSAAGSTALRESARRLYVAARYGRELAVTRGCECRLVLDAREQRYVLEYQPDADDPGKFVPVTVGIKPGKLDRKIRFGSVRIDPGGGRPAGAGPTAITFLPTGEADAALVQITDGERSLWLAVAAHSGRVELQDGAEPRPLQDRVDLDA